MRNLLKLIKNLSFLLCFGFGLNYMVVPVMAQSIVPPVIEEEAPDEEEIGGWSTLDKKTQETIANEKNQKEVEKDVKKDNKAAKKEAKKEEKAIAKAEKEQRKAIEKEQKSAEKDLKKANKKIEKLEEKCAKGKCDDEDLADLAAARASAESAQTALDAANQKANAFYAQDEDEAAAEYMAERDAQEA